MLQTFWPLKGHLVLTKGFQKSTMGAFKNYVDKRRWVFSQISTLVYKSLLINCLRGVGRWSKKGIKPVYLVIECPL